MTATKKDVVSRAVADLRQHAADLRCIGWHSDAAVLSELASAWEVRGADGHERDAHQHDAERLRANADPAAIAAFDRREAVRAADLPAGTFEAVDEIVRLVLPDDESWCIRGACLEMARFTDDPRRIARGGLSLADQIGIDEETAISVVGLVVRDLRLAGRLVAS